jgi:hypothetical protein
VEKISAEYSDWSDLWQGVVHNGGKG